MAQGAVVSSAMVEHLADSDGAPILEDEGKVAVQDFFLDRLLREMRRVL